MAFNWQELLDDIIEHRRVIPVIGMDLVDAPRPGCPTPFYRQMAAAAAEKLGQNCGLEALPADTDWTAFMESALGGFRPINRGFVSQAVDEAHRELKPAITPDSLPEGLRLLSRITDFPLVLTTTVDSSVAKAFGATGSRLLVSRLNDNADLPIDWQMPPRGSPPTVVHLFGRIGAAPDFAMTEEDVMEFMRNLQGGQAPKELLARLSGSDLLFLGTRFPDWLARFFIRLLRGVRLSDQNRQRFEALADPAVPSHAPLVAFLKKYSLRTRIYDEGSPLEFVRTLVQKWEEAQAEAHKARGSGILARPMRPGSLFISYANEDRAVVEAFAAALGQKLDVWLDLDELRGGADYDRVIRENIRKCDLFVPVMSGHTASRGGYFRNEWTEAGEHLKMVQPWRPYVVPVIIDGPRAVHLKEIEHYFEKPGMRTIHALSIPHGVLDDAMLGHFIEAVQKVRTASFEGAAATA